MKKYLPEKQKEYAAIEKEEYLNFIRSRNKKREEQKKKKEAQETESSSET